MIRIPSQRILAVSMAVVLLIGGSPAFAQSKSASASTPAELPSWERLSAAQRETLIAPIRERWNADPQARSRMLERAQRWHDLPPEERMHARRGMRRWEDMPPQKREEMRMLFEKTQGMSREQRRETMALYRQMRNMNPEQRAALRQQWQQMSADERKAWLHTHAPREHDPDDRSKD